jgi:hypothetical protein
MNNTNLSESTMPQRAGTTNPDWDAYVPKGQGRTDEQIRADVHELLMKEDGERTTGLSVSIEAGVATLRGRVRGASERQRLLARVREVPAVKDVVDQLEVASAPLTQQATDVASHGYELARDRARDVAVHAQDAAEHLRSRTHDYAERAQDYAWNLGSQARDYAQRIEVRAARGARTVGTFTSTHALPLALVGASLGYLFWSIRQERHAQRPFYTRRPTVGVDVPPAYYGAPGVPAPADESRRYRLATAVEPVTDGTQTVVIHTGEPR